MRSCADTCLESKGLSSECSDCYGNGFVCTTQCSLLCKDDSICQFNCEKSCKEDLVSCSGVEIIAPFEKASFTLSSNINSLKTTSVSEGMCNSSDLDHIFEIIGVFYACGNSCPVDGNLESCMTSCIAGKTGIRAQCADCFGQEAVCMANNCPKRCLTELDDDCQQCINNNCAQFVADCVYSSAAFAEKTSSIKESTSVASTVKATKSLCLNDADTQALIPTMTDQSMYTDCANSCIYKWHFEACYKTCIINKLKLSDGCGQCFAEEASCTKSKCWYPCAFKSGESCVKCSLDNCSKGLYECSGIDTSGHY
jgi:hypothetical protein